MDQIIYYWNNFISSIRHEINNLLTVGSYYYTNLEISNLNIDVGFKILYAINVNKVNIKESKYLIAGFRIDL